MLYSFQVKHKPDGTPVKHTADYCNIEGFPHDSSPMKSSSGNPFFKFQIQTTKDNNTSSVVGFSSSKQQKILAWAPFH